MKNTKNILKTSFFWMSQKTKNWVIGKQEKYLKKHKVYFDNKQQFVLNNSYKLFCLRMQFSKQKITIIKKKNYKNSHF